MVKRYSSFAMVIVELVGFGVSMVKQQVCSGCLSLCLAFVEHTQQVRAVIRRIPRANSLVVLFLWHHNKAALLRSLCNCLNLLFLRLTDKVALLRPLWN